MPDFVFSLSLYISVLNIVQRVTSSEGRAPRVPNLSSNNLPLKSAQGRHILKMNADDAAPDGAK